MALRTYVIRLRGDRVVELKASGAVEAIDLARSAAIEQFAELWDKDVEYVVSMESHGEDMTRLCAVEQNEVRCARPGCRGPYNCAERGLDLV